MELEVPSNDVYTEIFKVRDKLIEALDSLERSVSEHADAEDKLSEAWGKHLPTVEGKTKEVREAKANLLVSKERKEALRAKGFKELNLEKVRSYRQILSALQTLANSRKEEASALRYNQT